MKIIKGFFVFIVSFLLYHIILQGLFPATPEGMVDAPLWYTPLGMLLALLVAVRLTRGKRGSAKTTPPYVCIGVMTSDLNPMIGEIVEFAAIRYINDQERERFSALVRPKQEVSLSQVRMHGVTREMLMAAQRIEDVLPQFLSFLGNDPLVAHNIEFDMGFLNVNCAKNKIPLAKNPCIDTLEMSRELLPNLPNHKRTTVLHHFRLREDDPTRAISDCRNNHRCYVALRDTRR